MSARQQYVKAASQDQILHVTIDRAAKHNALSSGVLAELKQTFESYRTSPDVKLALLRGEGESSFAAGGDLRELDRVRSEQAARKFSVESREALDAIRNFPIPVVAVLNGDAIGGGAELAVACDARVAAHHARIGFIQGKLAISTAWGGGIDLMMLVGPTRALQLLARSEMLSAEEALSIGLVNAVSEEDSSLSIAVDTYVEPILKLAPQVLRAFKSLSSGVRAGLPEDRLRERETAHLVSTWTHDDHWLAAAGILKPKDKND
jgi:enoyl-CoA hydratase